MLKSLYIRNFAIIEEQYVAFVPGFNVITGETGSGKSIIIDALKVLLGARAYTDYIRQGEKKAIIEGVFEIKKTHPFISMISTENFDIETDEIIIRREIPVKGNSRTFLNDTPIQTQLLRELSVFLVDFHNQFDNQLLLKTDTHLVLLDNSGNYNEMIDDYRQKYFLLKQKVIEYNNLLDQESKIKEQTAFNRFQLDEILQVKPNENEDSLLEEELKLLEHSEELFSFSNKLYDLLFDSDNSVYSKLIEARSIIETISKIDSQFSQWLNEIETAIVTIKEISNFTSDYKSEIVFSPARIEEIRLRLLELKGLQKKYGPLTHILKLKTQLEESLEQSYNFENILKEKKNEIVLLKEQIAMYAEKLSTKRKEFSKTFSERIEANLHELGMPFSSFKTIFKFNISNLNNNTYEITNIKRQNTHIKLNERGIDTMEFYISTNKGEEPQPLSKVASGGEISRIMLAIKSLITNTNSLSLLVFDEIDSGIGGKIAQKVGLKMKELSKANQIIAITHLPQIASLAIRNINIEKIETDKRTIAKAKILNETEKKNLLNNMISGITVENNFSEEK